MRVASSRPLVVSLLFAYTIPSCAHGQTTTGRIAGVIKDQTGGFIAGAEVRVASISSGDERKIITDNTGSYAVPLLSPGGYRITIAAAGFKEEILEGINVAITETTLANAELTIGGMDATSITVSAAAPLVQSGGPQLGRVVDSRATSRLPLATRNFTQMLGLSTVAATYLPDGTYLGRNTQTISLNGARVTQNSFQLNGIDATTMDSAGSILVAVPAPEKVQEFKVQTSLYDAAFGRALHQDNLEGLV